MNFKSILIPTTLGISILVSAIVLARNDEHPVAVEKNPPIRSEAGLNIPDWGLAIDAAYDPRLDDLVRGYRIVNILVTNRGSQDVSLNVREDKWVIVDNNGKKNTAENHVKFFNKKIWDEMPQQLQNKLDYPPYVRAGHSVNIDVFFPKSTNLINFKEVIWRSATLGKEFNIYTNYEKTLQMGADDKNFTLPTSSAKVPWNKEQDQKSREEILNPQASGRGESGELPPNSPPAQQNDKSTFDPKLDEQINLDDTIIIR
jgi:hypothetical protein